jgi:hypothetical protein
MHRALAKFQEEIIGLVMQTAVHTDRYLYGTVRHCTHCTALYVRTAAEDFV